MENYELDQRILHRVLSTLEPDQLKKVELLLNDDEACYRRFQELVSVPDEGQTAGQEDLKDSWRDYMKTHSSRFLTLIDQYTVAYLKREKEQKGSAKRLDLENLVSNHTKWNRMVTDRGQGKQYRDDLRRLCFVFQLSYAQALELMWSASQLFEMDKLRDYVIVDCLTKRIYDLEQVNNRLMDVGAQVLFPED